MKIVKLIKDLVIEGKLSDYGKNNTPAALNKEKELGNKKVDPKASLEDLDLNTLGRNVTVKEYRYGPLNPHDEKGSKKFWQDKAKMWDTTVEAAKTSRCSNCVAFNQTAPVIKKMEKAIGEKGKEQSYVVWEISTKKESVYLKITVYPYFLQNVPKIISYFPYKLIVTPALKSYLKSVIGGINHHLKTKKTVPKNYFGKHKWFS